MMKRKVNLAGWVLMATVAVSAVVTVTAAMAQDQTRDRTQDRTQDQIYGSQLMTPAERNEYRQRMRNMKTQQEREAFRLEHHKLMQERARQRGLTLPDQVPAQRGGTGPGPGVGGGAGRGGR